MRKLFHWLAAMALAAVLPATQAAVTVYTNQAQFLAASSLRGTDSFDDLSLGLLAGPLNRTAGSYAYSVDVEHTQDLYTVGTGAANVALSTSFADSTLLFNHFASKVRGIGAQFFGTDFTGALASGASLHLQLTDASGTFSYDIGAGFFGLLSDAPIVSLRVSASQASGDTWAAVDNLSISAVPEPQALVMLVLGMALLAYCARRSMEKASLDE